MMRTLGLAATLGLVLFAYPNAIAQPQTVHLNIDGQPVDFAPRGTLRSEPLPPLLVDGHVMAPVRLFDELLGQRLSFRIVNWGVWELGWLAFRLGVTDARAGMAAVGGNASMSIPLPVAPREINSRVYVPLRAFAEFHGHRVSWDPETKTVKIIRKLPFTPKQPACPPN